MIDWIKCSDRLPNLGYEENYNKYYLTYDEEYKFYCIQQINYEKFSNSMKLPFFSDYCTHWAEIEPPKEQK